MTNPIIQEALRHLRRADPIMRDVIRRAGPFTLQLRRDRFSALVYSILGQQISGKAASAIRARLVNRLKPQRISATSLASLSPEELRAVGVSLKRCGEDRPIPIECRRCVQPPLEQVFSGEQADSRSRDALILVAHLTHGYRLAEIARFLTVDPSTVSKALTRARGRRSVVASACGA